MEKSNIAHKKKKKKKESLSNRLHYIEFRREKRINLVPEELCKLSNLLWNDEQLLHIFLGHVLIMHFPLV